jgi:stearoyl-CoA desaturase (delta-9 desaturase)
LTRQILIIALTSFVLTQIASFATSIYLHRALAHHSLSLRPALALLFRTLLWLLTGQSQQQWVAVHRKHHTFTDREGDPHSPKLLGFWRVQLWNVYYYVREARQQQIVDTFAPDLAPDTCSRRDIPASASARRSSASASAGGRAWWPCSATGSCSSSWSRP